jgi:hypothetical protein
MGRMKCLFFRRVLKPINHCQNDGFRKKASQLLLSPIIPTTLSLRTLEQLKKHIKDNKLKKIQLLPFFSYPSY